MSEPIIKNLMKQTGLSRDQIQAFLKLDQDSMNRLERGEQSLTTAQLHKIANLLGCTEEGLIKGSINIEPCFADRICNLKCEEMDVVAVVNKVASNLQMLNIIMGE